MAAPPRELHGRASLASSATTGPPRALRHRRPEELARGRWRCGAWAGVLRRAVRRRTGDEAEESRVGLRAQGAPLRGPPPTTRDAQAPQRKKVRGAARAEKGRRWRRGPPPASPRRRSSAAGRAAGERAAAR
ncbi:unnamed protein product [Urochloa humidicola]